MAELPLVPRSCETARQREWRSVKSSFDGLSHAQTSPQNRKNVAVNSIPKQDLLTPESVQCLSSPLARVLPGLGDGIHIALLLLRGSAKWPWGKQHQWRILLDLDPFWQAFINVSFKTEALLPLYFIYILWGSRWTANSDCYKKRSSIIWGKFTWHLLSQLRPAIPTCLCCFCKRALQAVNTLSFRVLVLT